MMTKAGTLAVLRDGPVMGEVLVWCVVPRNTVLHEKALAVKSFGPRLPYHVWVLTIAIRVERDDRDFDQGIRASFEKEGPYPAQFQWDVKQFRFAV
jgi:hypothetical protein